MRMDWFYSLPYLKYGIQSVHVQQASTDYYMMIYHSFTQTRLESKAYHSSTKPRFQVNLVFRSRFSKHGRPISLRIAFRHVTSQGALDQTTEGMQRPGGKAEQMAENNLQLNW